MSDYNRTLEEATQIFHHDEESDAYLHSIAVSLKRIADELEKINLICASWSERSGLSSRDTRTSIPACRLRASTRFPLGSRPSLHEICRRNGSARARRRCCALWRSGSRTRRSRSGSP